MSAVIEKIPYLELSDRSNSRRRVRREVGPLSDMRVPLGVLTFVLCADLAVSIGSMELEIGILFTGVLFLVATLFLLSLDSDSEDHPLCRVLALCSFGVIAGIFTSSVAPFGNIEAFSSLGVLFSFLFLLGALARRLGRS